jgi:hypothetical protein
LLTWDLVSTPSTHGAYLYLKESYDNLQENDINTFENINNIISNILELGD